MAKIEPETLVTLGVAILLGFITFICAESGGIFK